MTSFNFFDLKVLLRRKPPGTFSLQLPREISPLDPIRFKIAIVNRLLGPIQTEC
jgi:hypothetical protein